MSINFNKFSLFLVLLVISLLSGCISENETGNDSIGSESVADKSVADESIADESVADAFPENASANSPARSPVLAATTIAPLGSLISAVGKEKVDIVVLIPPGAEPHTYEPTPSQIREIIRADIYIMNGAGLEFWMEKVLEVNENMLIVDSSKGAELISEDGKIADPHIWMSPKNAAIQVDNICSGLIEVDPVNRDYYLQNKEEFKEELKALDNELNLIFGAKRNKTFITYHPAWSYFARDYSLQQVPIMEEEKEPGPRYLAGLIDLAKRENITTIFVEPQFNPRSAEVIAREMNATLVVLDPLAEDYLENMRRTGEEISRSLK